MLEQLGEPLPWPAHIKKEDGEKMASSPTTKQEKKEDGEKKDHGEKKEDGAKMASSSTTKQDTKQECSNDDDGSICTWDPYV